ncbi:unnamed protein product, partial [Amoebophrya sp. A25]|eukprot:GSA25T00008350001.1
MSALTLGEHRGLRISRMLLRGMQNMNATTAGDGFLAPVADRNDDQDEEEEIIEFPDHYIATTGSNVSGPASTRGVVLVGGGGGQAGQAQNNRAPLANGSNREEPMPRVIRTTTTSGREGHQTQSQTSGRGSGPGGLQTQSRTSGRGSGHPLFDNFIRAQDDRLIDTSSTSARRRALFPTGATPKPKAAPAARDGVAAPAARDGARTMFNMWRNGQAGEQDQDDALLGAVVRGTQRHIEDQAIHRAHHDYAPRREQEAFRGQPPEADEGQPQAQGSMRTRTRTSRRRTSSFLEEYNCVLSAIAASCREAEEALGSQNRRKLLEPFLRPSWCSISGVAVGQLARRKQLISVILFLSTVVGSFCGQFLDNLHQASAAMPSDHGFALPLPLPSCEATGGSSTTGASCIFPLGLAPRRIIRVLLSSLIMVISKVQGGGGSSRGT